MARKGRLQGAIWAQPGTRTVAQVSPIERVVSVAFQGHAGAGAGAVREHRRRRNVEQFLEWFPGVTREQALAVLKFAESSLAEAVV